MHFSLESGVSQTDSWMNKITKRRALIIFWLACSSKTVLLFYVVGFGNLWEIGNRPSLFNSRPFLFDAMRINVLILLLKWSKEDASEAERLPNIKKAYTLWSRTLKFIVTTFFVSSLPINTAEFLLKCWMLFEVAVTVLQFNACIMAERFCSYTVVTLWRQCNSYTLRLTCNSFSNTSRFFSLLQ